MMELYIGAGLAIGLAGLGVGIGEGIIARKSLDIMGKNPDLSGTILVLTILGIALTESAAIYGLIIALQILGLDPTILTPGVAIGAGLAVGGAGLGVGIGEGMLVSGAMDAIQKNPENKGKIMTFMVLFLALVESAAIYGLVVALMLLGKEAGAISGQAAMAAGLAVGLAGLGVGIGEGLIAKKSLQAMGSKPESSSSFLVITVLGIALTESAAIYGLIIALQIIGIDPSSMISEITIGAGLAVGLAGLGVGIGEGMLVSGAMDAIQKNPENKGKIMTFMVLFLALVESAAIYGLVVALMLLGKEAGAISGQAAMAAGLAVGLAGLGVGIGEGLIAKKSLQAMGSKPESSSSFLVITVLGIALTESAAIYGLIIALQIIGIDPSSMISEITIGAGLAVGLAGLGVGIGEGMLVSGAMDAIQKNPENKGKIMTFMVLFLALVESAAIYGLVVALMLLGKEAGAISGQAAMAAGLAVGLAGLGVGIGEGLIAKRSLKAMGEDSKSSSTFLIITVLGIALTESAAIYGLIIALQIIGIDPSSMISEITIGAGLAVGLAGLGVGIGEGMLVSGAMDAIQKNPENKGKIMTFMVLFLALVESAAIYGLVVALMLLGKEAGAISGQAAMAAGLAVGLAGLGVGIGEGLIAKRSLKAMGEDSKSSSTFLIVTILGIALTESAAIYGLIIALQIIGLDPAVLFNGSIGAGLAVGLAGLGVGIGEGMLVSGTIKAIQKNPAIKGKIMTFMVLFLALVESAAIYGLVVALMLLGIQGEAITLYSGVGAGLAIGLAGLGAGIGEGIIAKKSLDLMGRNQDLVGTFLIITILGVALVEASAIYGLIIALQIIGMEPGLAMFGISVGAGIAVGAAGLGVGKGFVAEGALGAIRRNPAIKGKAMTFMVLFLALVESVAIYGLVVALGLLK